MNFILCSSTDKPFRMSRQCPCFFLWQIANFCPQCFQPTTPLRRSNNVLLTICRSRRHTPLYVHIKGFFSAKSFANATRQLHNDQLIRYDGARRKTTQLNITQDGIAQYISLNYCFIFKSHFVMNRNKRTNCLLHFNSIRQCYRASQCMNKNTN